MTDWLNDDEQRLWRALLHGATRVFNNLDDSLQQSAGLPITDYEILVRLSEADGRKLRMSQLAAEVLISRSRLTYRVDQLIERGYVARSKSDDDRRGMYATVTEPGLHALEAAAPAHVRDVRHLVIDQIPVDDMAALTAIFERMNTAATEYVP